jgi:predicted 3-demethylubiquinone-9 3-methyltransferase (glyoxalase superfamily)
MSHKVKTCLWFDNQALPAAEFYCSLLPDSEITEVGRYPENATMGEPGSVLMVEFTLAGTPYQALNGGAHFQLSEAVSISVRTLDQEETDRLWNALTADGGSESQCGWCKDRFGLSWQIVPQRSVELLSGPRAQKVWPALMTMRKIDIGTLEAAAAA